MKAQWNYWQLTVHAINDMMFATNLAVNHSIKLHSIDVNYAMKLQSSQESWNLSHYS